MKRRPQISTSLNSFTGAVDLNLRFNNFKAHIPHLSPKEVYVTDLIDKRHLKGHQHPLKANNGDSHDTRRADSDQPISIVCVREEELL